MNRRRVSCLLPLVLLASCVRSPTPREEVTPVTSPVEERGIWLDKSDMFKPRSEVEKLLDDLAAAGFTTIYIDTQFKGGVAYPGSRYLPLAEQAKGFEGDPLTWFVAAIHRRKMRAEAWVEYGFYAYHTKDATKDKSEGVVLDRNPELCAIDAQGNRYLHHPQWGDFFSLCPSQPASQDALIDLYREVVTKYPVDGINLDRLRYARKDHCCCRYCRREFKQTTGLELKIYPDGSPEYAKFVSWREKILEAFVARMAAALRATRKDLVITACVVPVEEKQEKGQEWFSWVKDGSVDAVIPMLYTDEAFEKNLGEIEKKIPDRKKVFAGINAEGNPPEVVARHVALARKAGFGGVVMWFAGKIADDLPGLKEKIFFPAARSPFSQEAR